MPGSEWLFKNWLELPLKVNIFALDEEDCIPLYNIYLKVLTKFIR